MTASPIELLREHGALNASVAARIAADARITSAKASMLRALGLGGLLLGLGAGVGLACVGYSTMLDVGPQAQKIADIVAKTVAQTELRTTGTVSVAPGSQVSLLPGGRVALEPGGTVSMDPSSTVKAVGQPTIQMPVPAAPAAQPPLVPNPAFLAQASDDGKAPGGPVRTAIVVEKVVVTRSGPVITQWSYDQPSDPAPKRQACYKAMGEQPASAERDLLALVGLDGKPAGANDPQALANCVWFRPAQP